jgi:hypothetical protein
MTLAHRGRLRLKQDRTCSGVMPSSEAIVSGDLCLAWARRMAVFWAWVIIRLPVEKLR